MNKVQIKILESTNFVLKCFYRKKINVYNRVGNIYTIDIEDLDKVPFKNIEIVSYKGLIGHLYKLKMHKHFIFAGFISIVMLILVNFIIIDVDVIHSSKEIRELVEEELEKYKIHPFMIKKSFEELQRIKDYIKDDYPDKIEWLEIIDDGMKYTVRVEERIITEEPLEKEYCNVISTKDATILEVTSSKGQNAVLTNDFVKKGSTLISGEIKFNEEVKSYACAEGVVYGNTWYTVNVSLPYNYEEKKYTGKKSYNIGILMGSKLTEIFKVHLNTYETEKKKIFGVGNFSIYFETHKEILTQENKYSEEEALEKALEMGRKKILLNLDDDAEILSEKVLQSNSYNSIIDVDIFYSIKEKISAQVEMEIPKEEEGVTINESTE